MDYNSFITVPLKEMQYQFVDYARVHDYCMIAAKMGSGKTLIGIVSTLMNGGRVVVVCPAFLKFNWLKEFEKFSKRKLRIALVKGSNASKIDPCDYDVIILNYAILNRCEHLFVDATSVIYDEMHYLLNPKAARTKAAIKYTSTYLPKKLMLLSGTPNRGKGQQWYVPLLLCSINPSKNSGIDMRDHVFSYWDFQLYFCNRNIINVGGREITQFTGIKNVEKLKRLLRHKLIIGKRTTQEVALDFKDVYVDYKVKDKELQEAWEEYEAGNPITEHIMSAKSASALAKVKFTCEYSKNIVDSTQTPVIIFTDHLAPLEAMETELKKKYRVAAICGATPMEKRNEIVEGFQNGDFDFLVATIKAANTGLTLTRSHHMVINDSNWNFQEMDQAYHRIYRIGQTEDCLVHNILGSEVCKRIIKNMKKDSSVVNKVIGDLE